MRLLAEDRILIDFPHLLGEGHRITDWEIRVALLDGEYDFHEDVEDRFVAQYARKREGVVITVIFEIREDQGERSIFVPTAFGPGRRR